MSSIWKINGQLPETNNLGRLKLSVTTQAPDVLTLTQAAAYDANPVYADGAEVTLTRNNGSGDAQWFKGICTGIARRGSGTAERIDYQISGPWWQLAQVIYRQQFLRYVDGVESTPTIAKLVLGTDDTGARLNSGQVITAVANYALTQLGASAIFQLGTIEPTTQMPYEELNALSCADVITRVLRWNPDVVAYFDYATSPPTLHCKRRASLPTQTHALADLTITENSINPRHDLQKEGVVIQYERTDTIGGNEQKVIIEDTAGTITNPAKTLYLFFDLRGGSVSFIRQKVKSATIQKDSVTWWQARHPKLKEATDITIKNAVKTAVNDVDEGGENDGTAYAKELISGSIADWMGGVGVCSQIIAAEVGYTSPSGKVNPPDPEKKLRLQVAGTNANSQTYTTVGSASAAEPTPTGLAAAIHASLSQLQHEGTVILTQAEAGGATHIDKKLNIAGARTEWATMAAQVYQVAYDLDQGRTQISFGPAKHLGANDLFQLLRNVRTRKSGSATARTGSAAAENDLPSRSPNTIAADDGGAGPTEHPFRVVDDGDGTVSVIVGYVNFIAATNLTPTGKPTTIWLKCNLTAMPEQDLDTVEIYTGATAPTETASLAVAKIATINWAGDTPTINQIVSNNLQLSSCTDYHQFYRF